MNFIALFFKMWVFTKKRFEHLDRLRLKIWMLYDWLIIIWDLDDSWESPKELVNEFFRIWYELNENINNEFPELKSDIENLIKKHKYLAISIDYANYIKHWKLIKRLRKSKVSFGHLNTTIILFDNTNQVSANRTELTLEINWTKNDIKFIIERILLERNKVFEELNIVI